MAEKEIRLPYATRMVDEIKERVAKERQYTIPCCHQFFIVTARGNRCLVCKEEAR